MSERTSTWQQAKQSLTVRTAHGRRGQRESNNIFPGLASLSAFLWSTSVFSAPLGSVDLTHQVNKVTIFCLCVLQVFPYCIFVD